MSARLHFGGTTSILVPVGSDSSKDSRFRLNAIIDNQNTLNTLFGSTSGNSTVRARTWSDSTVQVWNGGQQSTVLHPNPEQSGVDMVHDIQFTAGGSPLAGWQIDGVNANLSGTAGINTSDDLLIGRDNFGNFNIVGVIYDFEVYDSTNTLIHKYAIDDDVADGGTILDSVGSAHGILTLGNGEWLGDEELSGLTTFGAMSQLGSVESEGELIGLSGFGGLFQSGIIELTNAVVGVTGFGGLSQVGVVNETADVLSGVSVFGGLAQIATITVPLFEISGTAGFGGLSTVGAVASVGGLVGTMEIGQRDVDQEVAIVGVGVAIDDIQIGLVARIALGFDQNADLGVVHVINGQQVLMGFEQRGRLLSGTLQPARDIALDLKQFIEGLPEINLLTGGHVYHDKARQGVVEPMIVLTESGPGESVGLLDGQPVQRQSVFHAFSYGPDRGQANQLAEALRPQLEDYRGIMGSWLIDNIENSNYRDAGVDRPRDGSGAWRYWIRDTYFVRHYRTS